MPGDLDPSLTHPMQEAISFSAESYFATQPAPSSLAQDIAGVKEFVSRQAAQNRNVVLVTVGVFLRYGLESHSVDHAERRNDCAVGTQRVRALALRSAHRSWCAVIACASWITSVPVSRAIAIEPWIPFTNNP